MDNHYQGKDPLAHVAEKQAEGILSSSETHGTEIPGPINAFSDALRETSVYLALLSLFLPNNKFYLLAFSIGLILWKTGRSAWLGWSRLERLHRLLNEEKWEIENHREQEKEELATLYRARGFEGKLLDDAVEVLMADNDRALRVMLEEELGLSLEKNEHPLKQAFAAFLGGVLALILAMLNTEWFTLPFLSALGVALGAFLSARYEKNREVRAIVWNLSLFGLSYGCVYFLLQL